jgi:hypothetical protein
VGALAFEHAGLFRGQHQHLDAIASSSGWNGAVVAGCSDCNARYAVWNPSGASPYDVGRAPHTSA